MNNVSVISHPVVDRYLTYLRDKNTNTALFRRAMSNIGIILAYHALNDLKLEETEVETPIQKTVGYEPGQDRKSTRLNSSHSQQSRMPSSA